MCKKSNVSRRTFLKLAGAGTLSAALSGSIIPGTIKHAFAAGNRPILIVLDFSGGVSNNIMPYTHAAYMNRMQGIFPGGNLTLGSAPQKLHPALASLYPIFQDGDMAVYNKVGYPNPNRSHAESHDIIWSGKRQGNNAAAGWGAALNCNLESNVLGAVSAAGLNTFSRGECSLPSVGDVDNFGSRSFWGSNNTKHLNDLRRNLIFDSAPAANPGETFLRNEIVSMEETVRMIQQSVSNINLPISFPNTGLGRQMENVAKLIASPLNTCLFYTNKGGFDTHSGEAARLNNLLQEVGGALDALIQFLKLRGEWNNTIIITMTEFFRTFVNGSGGTDHGHAGPLFAMGGRVQGGVKTPPPSEAETNAANGFYREHTVDFRDVYSAAIRAMGIDPGTIFTESYQKTTLDLI